MKILVTGGSGFIGSYVLLELLKRGERPIVFDLYSASAVTAGIQEKVTWIQGDIRDLAQVENVVAQHRPEVVINLAGLLQWGCTESPRLAIEVNVLGLSNVLEAAKKYSVRRMVTASSSAAYGPFMKRVTEKEPILPNVTLYGATKFLGEILCQQYIDNYGLEASNMRFFGVYGPGEVRSPGIAKVLKDIESTVTGKSITLPAIKATDHVHLVFVADAAAAMVLAAMKPGPVSLVYNVVGGEDSYVTFGDIVKIIQSLIPDCGQVLFQGKGRDRGPMDISLARRELGYVPQYTPLDGFRECIKYFKRN